MINPKQVGKKIKSLRWEKKMTQDDLASKLYVTRQALSKWERGESLPSIDVIMLIGREFNVTFEEILCLNEKKEFDPNDIFKNHDRMVVINKIINQEVEVDIPSIFYLLSPVERSIILQHIKTGKLKCNMEELIVKLTPKEKEMLGGFKDEN